MARIVVRPGEKVEICFANTDGLLMHDDSIVLTYYPTFTPEAHIEKVSASTRRVVKVCEVEINE